MSPVISYLIPLYRSARFHDVIVANVRALATTEDEILLCDRHGDTETCRRLQTDLAELPNVQVTSLHDKAHWVRNIAELIDRAEGEFLRVLPHDDSTDRAETQALLDALRADPSAVLAFGQIEAIDLQGGRLPHRDEPNDGEDPGQRSWTLGDVLPMFWTGRFGGAFKGLVRTEMVRRDELRFRPTPSLLYSERVWLFSLGLAGPMRFVPQRVLIKRYHATSTHASWRETGQSLLEAASMMAEIVSQLIANQTVSRYAVADLRQNAISRAEALDAGLPQPTYSPREHERAALYRALELPSSRA